MSGCLNGGTCINNGKYDGQCICFHGDGNPYCGKTCELRCLNGGSCDDIGASMCTCPDGYEGPNCENEG